MKALNSLSFQVDKLLKDKRVKCPEASCTFRSPLGVFLMHSHGRQRFVNEQVDLESLRPTRPTHLSEQVIILPGIAIPGMVRAANIREQLQEVGGPHAVARLNISRS